MATKRPANLSPAMRRFWKQISESFELLPDHQRTLELACRSWDRAEGARLAIEAGGMLIAGKRHPLIGVEAKAREVFLRALRELGLGEQRPAPLTPSDAGRRAANARWHGEAA